jgi:hypothetical protein
MPITIFTFVAPYCFLLGYCALGLGYEVVKEFMKDDTK